MRKILKKLVLPLVFVLGLVGGFLVARQLPNKLNYSPAVTWVIENPEYAERMHSAYENHITAAEAVLMEELGGLSGKKE